MKIKVSLLDQPTIFKIAEFSVTIQPCAVTDFLLTTGPENQDYIVKGELQSLGSLVAG